MDERNKYQAIERQHGKPMKDVLAEYFSVHGTQRAVAKALKVNQSTVYVWLLRLGLKQKTTLVSSEENTRSESAQS